jgi:hypothetical protein
MKLGPSVVLGLGGLVVLGCALVNLVLWLVNSKLERLLLTEELKNGYIRSAHHRRRDEQEPADDEEQSSSREGHNVETRTVSNGGYMPVKPSEDTNELMDDSLGVIL